MPSIKDLPEDQRNAAIDWLENLPNHPKIGTQIKRLLKEADTRVQFPEVELEDRVVAQTRKAEEKIDKFLEDQKAEKNKAYWEGKRKEAREKYKLDDEDIKKVEKFMVDEHVGNYELAAKHYTETARAPAEPTNIFEERRLALPNSPGLFQNETGWARNEAAKFLAERQKERG